jgi:hypothetical protein
MVLNIITIVKNDSLGGNQANLRYITEKIKKEVMNIEIFLITLIIIYFNMIFFIVPIL